jgi:hypothetical protein
VRVGGTDLAGRLSLENRLRRVLFEVRVGRHGLTSKELLEESKIVARDLSKVAIIEFEFEMDAVVLQVRAARFTPSASGPRLPSVALRGRRGGNGGDDAALVCP